MRFATPSPRLIPKGEESDTFTGLAMVPNEGRTLRGWAVEQRKAGSVRRLKRPDFEQWTTGGWINPDILDMELKQRLWDIFPKRLTWAAKADVLYSVGESVQTAQAFFDEAASSVRVEQLQRVQTKARELLQALAALKPDTGLKLDAHLAYLVLGTDAPEQVSQFTKAARQECEAIARWWDVVQDIEVSAAYAKGHEKPLKTERPAVSNAKRLVFFTANAVYSVLGTLPPRGKGTWFPEFVRELGSAFGLRCGQALVDAVVRDMVKDCRYEVQAPKQVSVRRHIHFVVPVPSPD